MISWQVMVSVTSISVAIRQAQIGPWRKNRRGVRRIVVVPTPNFWFDFDFFSCGEPHVWVYRSQPWGPRRCCCCVRVVFSTLCFLCVLFLACVLSPLARVIECLQPFPRR